MNKNSLKRSLINSNVLSFLILMLFCACVVYVHFIQEIEKNAQQQLRLHVYNLLSVAELNGDQLYLPAILYNPKFNTLNSGLWAFVLDDKNNIAWQSLSIVDRPDTFDTPNAAGEWLAGRATMDGSDYLTMAYQVTWQSGQNSVDYVLVIGETTKQLQSAVNQLTLWLLIVFVVVTIIVLAGQTFVLNRAFNPIEVMACEISELEKGSRSRLSDNYPAELQGVARNINALIAKEDQQRQRYRDGMANLAHSIKTPMTTLTSELTGVQNNKLVLDAIDRVNKSVEYHLHRTVIAGHTLVSRGVDIRDALDQIIMALNKIYSDRAPLVECDLDNYTVFWGDENDLMEIVGNLLDNAFKYAREKIRVAVKKQQKQLVILVEDDGPGLTDDTYQRIFRRGERLDQAEPGQGIGLAVVADIVSGYGGDVAVSRSEMGGAHFVVRFKNREEGNA